LKTFLKKIPAPYRGDIIPRIEPCRICHACTGRRIGVVDYWDLKTSALVQCLHCSHIQLDPMPDAAETAEGCHAYYVEESLRTSLAELEKNCERNFRRGVVFGYKLRHKGIRPRAVLELGPGSGYFSAGLQFVFPGAQVTVLDVNRELLGFIAGHHGYRTIEAVPDEWIEEEAGGYDLVIARDILEHVTDIDRVLENVVRYLKPGGYFHFITPNGHEDAWKHYLAYRMTGQPSELLINHVNYFDGTGLGALLQQKGMNEVAYFTYNLKYTWRGSGSKEKHELAAPQSRKLSASHYTGVKAGEMQDLVPDRNRVLGKWYIRCGIRRVTWLYSLIHHFQLIRLSPVYNVGHEIYGIFRKNPGSLL
jgi:SAM-dependent methyltransferase